MNNDTDHYIESHLPLLKTTFFNVNPAKAQEWTEAFAKAGITDGAFPLPYEIMRDTCQMLGLILFPADLYHFNETQYQFFGKIVENGGFIEYPSDKPTPYKAVYAQGFPVSGTFGQVEKVVMWAYPGKVFARKRLLHINETEMHRIRKEVLLLHKSARRPWRIATIICRAWACSSW